MNDSVKVGVVGVGSLGQWHARVFASACPGAGLAGVYDPDAARAREIADRYHTRAFESLDALAGAVQAASIVVPTPLHLAVALPLIERGIHVLVEKPIAVTGDEADTLIAAAERRGVVLQVGHIERFNPALAWLDSVLDTPRCIEAVRLAPYPPARPGLPPRGTEVSVVLDLMIHDLEIALHLAGAPVREFHAWGMPVLSPGEDIANARLHFANGCVAHLTAGRVGPDKTRALRVYQRDAALSIDYQAQTGQIARRAGAGLETADAPITKGDALERELTAFVACVRERRAPLVGGRQAAEALRLADAICRRIRAGDPR